MAKNCTLTDKLREQLLSGVDIRTIFDSGELRIFPDSVAQPADAGEAEGGTAIVTITLPANAFEATVTDGVLSKEGTWEANASAGGNLSWFRLYDASTTTGADETVARLDGTVGVTAGQFNLIVDSVAVLSGQLVQVVTFDLTVPKTVKDVTT